MGLEAGGIRIVGLPSCRMAVSGLADEGDPFADGGKLRVFDKWWTELDKRRKDMFYSRDFMWYDREMRRLEWGYALTDEAEGTGGFDVIDFEGGLYAAHISKDGDDTDGERVYAMVKAWVENSGCFELDERPGHYDVFHVTTPKDAARAMGFYQLDIYVPVRVKGGDIV